MKKVILGIVAIASVALTGCTDASFAKLTSYGSQAQVTCYSGGKVIFNGHSTGKVKSEKDSDGYYFEWKETGDLVEVSGQCILNYGH